MNILEEADFLINGARQEKYGHPYDDFSRTAQIWSAILDTYITPEQVALCMVGLKLSRECNQHQEDNLIDAAGYLGTCQMVIEERTRRGENP
jgi:hypothetical protein